MIKRNNIVASIGAPYDKKKQHCRFYRGTLWKKDNIVASIGATYDKKDNIVTSIGAPYVKRTTLSLL